MAQYQVVSTSASYSGGPDWNPGYPDWGLSWFSSVCPGKCQNSTLN
jgi:hypothetical protein